MTNKTEMNYINSISASVDHKKLNKAKRAWALGGLSFLATLGLGATALTGNAHASSVHNISKLSSTNHGNQRHINRRHVTLRSHKMNLPSASTSQQKINQQLKNQEKADESHISTTLVNNGAWSAYKRVFGTTPFMWHSNPKNDAKFAKDHTWGETVKFYDNGKYVGKSYVTFVHDEHQASINLPKGYSTSDGKTSVTITNHGYDNHVISADYNNGTFTNHGKNYYSPYSLANVNVQKINNSASIKVNYKDGNMTVGNDTLSGNKGSNAADAIKNDVPAGYNLNNSANLNPDTYQPNATYTIPVDRQAHQVVDTVNYTYDGNTKGSAQVIGMQGKQGTASSDKVPSGYHLANDGSQNFTFDGGSHDVKIEKNAVTPAPKPQPKPTKKPSKPVSTNMHVDYQYNGKSVGSHDFQDNPVQSFKVGNQPSGLPQGYGVFNPNQILDGHNHNQVVQVAPEVKDTLVYMNHGHKVGQLIINGPRGQQFDVGLKPQGLSNKYAPVTPKKAYTRNGQTYNIPVTAGLKEIPNVNVLHNGEAGIYKGIKVERVNMDKDPAYRHFRWFKMSKHGAWMHTNILTVSHRKDYVFYMQKNHGIYHRIRRVFRVYYGNHGRNYVRYEFRIGNFDYFVTANPNFTVNSYWQRSEFKGHNAVRVIRPCAEYTSRYYNHKTHVRNFKKGQLVHIKGIIDIGRKGDWQTRFIMSNGHYITANKNFVNLV